MEFVDLLRRYHISPLSYEDGVLLDKKDYSILFDMFERYQTALKIINGEPINTVKFESEVKKIKNFNSNSLFSLTEEEIFDIMLNKEQQEVLK